MWAISHQDSFNVKFPTYTKQETWAMEINKEKRERTEDRGKEKQTPITETLIQLPTVFH